MVNSCKQSGTKKDVPAHSLSDRLSEHEKTSWRVNICGRVAVDCGMICGMFTIFVYLNDCNVCRINVLTIESQHYSAHCPVSRINNLLSYSRDRPLWGLFYSNFARSTTLSNSTGLYSHRSTDTHAAVFVIVG